MNLKKYLDLRLFLPGLVLGGFLLNILPAQALPGQSLAAVKKCLDLHQGHIAVESQLGTGTAFTMAIPQKDGGISQGAGIRLN